MNKVIPSTDRMLMSLVGPSGSGKSELIHKMLLNGTFQPKFDKVFYFYQYYQVLYDRILETVENIEFIKFTDFQMIQKFPNDGTNYLLIFDDSSTEILESKVFEKIATAGRHRKFSVIYIKHNLFHKSSLGRDVELQNTHIILFKSPRDVNQIGKFGQQLGIGKELLQWYIDATSVPFGHLLVDLSPRTNDKLRYCTDFGTFPTRFYLKQSDSRITTIDDNSTKHLYAQALPTFYTKTTTSIPHELLKGIHSFPLRVYKKSNSRSRPFIKKRSAKIQETNRIIGKENNFFKRKKTNSFVE